MYQRGFTLLELMVVLMVIGLLAGATAWSLADNARRHAHKDAIGLLRHVDRMTRLIAQRTQKTCVLRIDLDRGYLRRLEGVGADRQEFGHRIQMPPSYRIERVTGPALAFGSGRGESIRHIDSGEVDISYAPGGTSGSYAVAIGAADNRDSKRWLVVAGLTGQTTEFDDPHEVENLFDLLATGRSDAD